MFQARNVSLEWNDFKILKRGMFLGEESFFAIWVSFKEYIVQVQVYNSTIIVQKVYRLNFQIIFARDF